jgi:hypothetical protein
MNERMDGSTSALRKLAFCTSTGTGSLGDRCQRCHQLRYRISISKFRSAQNSPVAFLYVCHTVYGTSFWFCSSSPRLPVLVRTDSGRIHIYAGVRSQSVPKSIGGQGIWEILKNEMKRAPPYSPPRTRHRSSFSIPLCLNFAPSFTKVEFRNVVAFVLTLQLVSTGTCRLR